MTLSVSRSVGLPVKISGKLSYRSSCFYASSSLSPTYFLLLEMKLPYYPISLSLSLVNRSTYVYSDGAAVDASRGEEAEEEGQGAQARAQLP